MKKVVHIPVLLQEVVENLKVDPDGTYVDCTLGDGGYSVAILDRLSAGRLVSLDVDTQSISFVTDRYRELLETKNWTIIRENFSKLQDVIEELEIKKIDGIVFDLGLSSRQLDADKKERGFSYLRREKLDMRMDDRLGVTAEDLIRALSKKELTLLIARFGEERYAKRIASELKKYVANERDVPLTSDTVAALVRKVVPAGYREGPRHPARRVFQALRIAVNDELRSLQQGIASALSIVSPGGRVIAVSYHSLEDRIVKELFKKSVEDGNFTLPHKGIIEASEKEVRENPRSRSAKLRVIEKMNK